YNALLVGAVLVRQLVGRTVAQRAGVARTPRGVVRQTVRDLLGHNGVCAALVVEAATFSDVEHGERRDESPTRIVRASNRDALLCCVNGQSRAQGWSGRPTCATNPVGGERSYRGRGVGFSG